MISSMSGGGRTAFLSAMALSCACGASGGDPSSDAGVGDAGAGDAATEDRGRAFVVLPDTQYYSSDWPEILESQITWINDHAEDSDIQFVLHVGDVVDDDTDSQWRTASEIIGRLRVPYVITAGNHDYAYAEGAYRTTKMNEHFGIPSWVEATFEPGRLENSYSLLGSEGARWLVLALEFGPRDDVLDWADGVLASHPETPAILVTHAYLYRDGTRYDHESRSDQMYGPHDYGAQLGPSINDGEEMWRKLVREHENVRFVFSGHDVSGEGIPPGTAARLESVHAGGGNVFQILANYQTCTSAPCDEVRGGDGFLRIVRTSPVDGRFDVRTYSPYLDQSLLDEANDFSVGFNR